MVVAVSRSASNRGIEADASFPTLDTLEDIGEGVTWLTANCPFMHAAHARAGMPPLRREPGGFAGLADIIVSQLVSLAAADAIFTRLKAAVVPLAPEQLLAASDESLRAVGLSGAKVKSLRAVAQSIADGDLNLDGLNLLSDAEAKAQLESLPGIGPWTSDIYVMFCLGRRDGFAPGDLALRVAVGELLGLADRPSVRETAEIAVRWRPWRGVAARQLWAYYRVNRLIGRES